MLEGYLNDIAEKDLHFISEDHKHFKAVTGEHMHLRLEDEIVEKDIASGYLLNNRFFKMFGCTYNGISISYQGYVYW